MSMLKIIDVKHLDNYKLQLVFNDETIVIVDLRDELDGPVFEPLRELNYFRTVSLSAETGTIAWSNGADFAPEFLKELGKGTTVYQETPAH